MSGASAPPTASTGPSPGSHAAARAAAPGQRKPGARDAADPFATLLSLLSASDEAPARALVGDALAPAGADPAATPAAGDATLAAMMQWAGLPQAQASPGSRGAASASGPATASPDTTADPAGAGTLRPAPGASDPLPQGLQRLDRPEAPDAQTLAALPASPPEPARATDPAPATHTTPVMVANPASAARAAHAGHGQPTVVGTQALPQPHHAQARTERRPVQVHCEAALAQRSTVMLDDRFAASNRADTPLGPTGGDTTGPWAPAQVSAGPVSGTGGDLAGQAGGDGGAGPSNFATDPQRSDDGEAEPGADADGAQAPDRPEACAGPAAVRQASLRVGGAGEDAIDIRLSLTGQALDLGFRTDNAEARAALARHADSDLAELLQRGGLQLGDVSVGAHRDPSAGQDPRQAAHRRPPAALPGERAAAPAGATQTAPPRPRPGGNRPLDLFV